MTNYQKVRIGGAAAFLGDSSISVPQLIRGGKVDYIILDYLAEVTMSLLARSKAKRPRMGYAPYFVDVIMAQNIRDIAQQGIKIVTNAGGVNPHACRDAILKLMAETDASLDLKVAVVDGDDLLPRHDELSRRGLTDMNTGSPWPDNMMSMNAYLGAKPIAEALDMGADVVITGRVVDSALTLGPLMHEFKWQETDYDLLAAGSMAGHIIECGAQATGGLFTDWQEVPDWANIGYPVIECYADGRFVVSKPDDTGGIVTPATVGEQLLYEIGDPQAYLLPDVVCDFSKVKIVQVGDNQVEVTGGIGQPPPECYKVYSAYQDGYRCFAISPVIGMNAVQKAERMAEALIKRTRLLFQQQNLGDYRDTLVECIGAESAYGPHARSRDTREVACKISLEHERPEALQIFASEAYAPTTSMSPGTTGWFVGKPYVSPIIRLFSFLIPKNEVPFTITLNDNSRSFTQSPTEVFNPASIIRPRVADITDAGAEMKTVPLVQLAWGRSGDKGNSCNIGIMARKPEFLPYIRKVLTESAVYEFMNHIFHGAEKPGVERFDLPGINALNFLLHESLGGGQMASLRLDPLAKGMAQQLLEFPTPVPVSLL
ncbi:MAG: DUF1446 domain-containing protein [Deltaproteobacteria bacterium]|nr:DUF1446 domain-containing protein [Deltaproteobacteria bacterium]